MDPSRPKGVNRRMKWSLISMPMRQQVDLEEVEHTFPRDFHRTYRWNTGALGDWYC